MNSFGFWDSQNIQGLEDPLTPQVKLLNGYTRNNCGRSYVCSATVSNAGICRLAELASGLVTGFRRLMPLVAEILGLKMDRHRYLIRFTPIVCAPPTTQHVVYQLSEHMMHDALG